MTYEAYQLSPTTLGWALGLACWSEDDLVIVESLNCCTGLLFCSLSVGGSSVAIPMDSSSLFGATLGLPELLHDSMSGNNVYRPSGPLHNEDQYHLVAQG